MRLEASTATSGSLLNSRAFVAFTVGIALTLTLPLAASAQTYTVTAEESGSNHSTYTKRYNWREWNSNYGHTTAVPHSENRNHCAESPCFDDDEPGDRGPDGTRGGTAKATLSGMTPGTYQIELRFRQSANRTTSVPWSVSSDASSNNTISGDLDQRNTTTDAMGSWVVIGNSNTKPINVNSSVTVFFGSDTKNFNGSLSYGGFRLTKVVAPVDNDGDSYPSNNDCDDSNPNIHPGATEVCNGKDDDCDITVDEACGVDAGTNPPADAGQGVTPDAGPGQADGGSSGDGGGNGATGNDVLVGDLGCRVSPAGQSHGTWAFVLAFATGLWLRRRRARK